MNILHRGPNMSGPALSPNHLYVWSMHGFSREIVWGFFGSSQGVFLMHGYIAILQRCKRRSFWLPVYRETRISKNIKNDICKFKKKSEVLMDTYKCVIYSYVLAFFSIIHLHFDVHKIHKIVDLKWRKNRFFFPHFSCFCRSQI